MATETVLPLRLSQRVEQYRFGLRLAEAGRVLSVGDGIAWVGGLPSAVADEIVQFDDALRTEFRGQRAEDFESPGVQRHDGAGEVVIFPGDGAEGIRLVQIHIVENGLEAGAIFHADHHRAGIFNDFQNPFVRKLYQRLERISAKFTDKIVVVSNHDRQKGLDHKIGSDGKYSVLRYGIDRAQFGMRDPSIRKELGISDDALVVGTIACFKPQRRQRILCSLLF